MKLERHAANSLMSLSNVYDSEERMRDAIVAKLGFGKQFPRHEVGPLWLNILSQSLNAAGTDKSAHLGQHEYQLAWLLFRSYKNESQLTHRECEDFVYEDQLSGKGIPLSNSLEASMHDLRSKVRGLVGNQVYITNARSGYWSLKVRSVDGLPVKKKIVPLVRAESPAIAYAESAEAVAAE